MKINELSYFSKETSKKQTDNVSLFVSNGDDVLFCYFDKRVTEYLFKSSQFVVKTKIKSQKNEIT